MKKRLRKKKHYGKFSEWGRQLVITRNRKDGLGEFLDAFIEEAIEANGCVPMTFAPIANPFLMFSTTYTPHNPYKCLSLSKWGKM